MAKLQDIPLEKDWLDDPNPHKFSIFWASGMYKLVNYNMRTTILEKILEYLPNTLWFIQNYLKYFQDYGITSKELIQRNITKLYRGIRNTSYFEIKIGDTYNDRGFIATSYEFNIADNISGRDMILYFDVNSIPLDTKVVIIDDRIEMYLQESEVLLMPGKITIVNEKNTKYEPDISLINSYLKAPTPTIKMLGGGAFKIPNIKIEGKLLVFYRAIHNRPVEVLKVRTVPLEPDKEFHRNLKRTMDLYEYIPEFIPEFIDLRNITLKPPENISNEEYTEARLKRDSYMIHIALWNGEEIETIHLFEYALLFEEVFDMSKKDIVQSELKRLLKENLPV